MKKILSLGTAAAVLSLTAVAASAAITPVVSDTAVAGDQVVVELVANGITEAVAELTVVPSANLTLVDSAATTNGFAFFNPDNMKFSWASAEAPADGDVLLTLTFTVDAAAGEDVSVVLEGTVGEIDTTPVAVEVVDPAGSDESDESYEESSEESSEESTEDPTIVDESSEESSEEGGDNTGDNTGNETNPDTGIALAVVPALVAGAAIVASKKRK
ncbi:MAG: hypothetical protein ACI4Q4_00555 [Oscillospiraceae bacterium]